MLNHRIGVDFLVQNGRYSSPITCSMRVNPCPLIFHEGMVGLNVCMFDGSTYCEDDDSAALVDGVAKGFTNLFSSTSHLNYCFLLLGLRLNMSCVSQSSTPLPLESEELEVLDPRDSYVEAADGYPPI
ncbi:hypothetical protein Tco_1030178 [Tanacetum coccineum]|uniref:Uncharacterized protein n=1 Tax=Tanacetum coccineum TaxID=301880 RepID=A0ABQ5G5I1_9ASTR